ncbi:MAG: DnaK suppressor protein [Actinomycetota bacterium]|nr:DnaK suppressor protein [Actinomycetota bacterium]
MITATARTEELDAMLVRFEEQYEARTQQLAWLLSRRRSRGMAVSDVAEIASCRQALAETAHRLQLMADRDFGRCLQCSGDIPVERLTDRPGVRVCPSCERAIPV